MVVGNKKLSKKIGAIYHRYIGGKKSHHIFRNYLIDKLCLCDKKSQKGDIIFKISYSYIIVKCELVLK